jgi:phosphoribosyl 1,2-cyclic phosphodiesterase
LKLTFAGTRGYIDLHAPEHERHSSLLLEYRRHTVLVDCGEDWLGHLDELDSPEAIVITHAHPDHAWGLKNGWDGPVWATPEAWESMARFPVADRQTLPIRTAATIGGLVFTAFPLIHSIRAPAVGLRVRAGKAVIFYAPDVLWIEDRDEALDGVGLYVGDGASLQRDLVRKRGDVLIGHVSVRRQLSWCAKAGIARAIITHCGTGIVRDHATAAAHIEAFGRAVGVEASLATDGLVVTVRS